MFVCKIRTITFPHFIRPLFPSFKGAFTNYVTLKGGRGGISQCDDVYIKHTFVWDNV